MLRKEDFARLEILFTLQELPLGDVGLRDVFVNVALAGDLLEISAAAVRDTPARLAQATCIGAELCDRA